MSETVTIVHLLDLRSSMSQYLLCPTNRDPALAFSHTGEHLSAGCQREITCPVRRIGSCMLCWVMHRTSYHQKSYMSTRSTTIVYYEIRRQNIACVIHQGPLLRLDITKSFIKDPPGRDDNVRHVRMSTVESCTSICSYTRRQLQRAGLLIDLSVLRDRSVQQP